MKIAIKMYKNFVTDQEVEAIFYLDKAIDLEPNNSSAYRYIGKCLNRLNKCEEAIECFNKSIELNPNDTKAYKNKSHSLGLLGKHHETI